MNQYNKIMLYFWLSVGVFVLIGVTYMGMTEGFSKWMTSYTFSALAFLMYFMRRYMIRRMEKHVAYLAEQEKNNSDSEE